MNTLSTTIKTLVAVALTSVFVACNSSDDITEPAKKMEISIAKQPTFKIEAGGVTLVNTDLTRSLPGNPDVRFFKKANCPDLFRENFPDQKISKDVCEHVYACIKEDAALIAAGQAPKYEVEKKSFRAKTFYIVNAYSSKDHDAKGEHSDVAGDMHDLGINNQYITEFNTNVCIAANLIITSNGLEDVTYDDSFGTKRENYTTSNWKLFNIPEYGYFIGMDYGTNKFGYEPDGDYSDWVIAVIPTTPKKEDIDGNNSSVEVNLSVNDEHSEGDYVATKLSIHVRVVSDIEVFIPVDKKYYCEADDMDISISHKQADIVYNTQPQFVQKQVGGTTVTFKVEYEDAGIRISTSGIIRSVIDFCANEYYDGITFEVWNYFKDIARNDLKPMLDKATVTFIDNAPATYINAFAKIGGYSATPVYNKFNEAGQLVPYTDPEFTQPLDQKYWTRETPESKDYIFLGERNPWDCTVVPADSRYTKTSVDESDPTLSNYNVKYTIKK